MWRQLRRSALVSRRPHAPRVVARCVGEMIRGPLQSTFHHDRKLRSSKFGLGGAGTGMFNFV